MPFGEVLSDDEKTVLDLIADLALRGHDARPLHLAYQLKWTRAKVAGRARAA